MGWFWLYGIVLQVAPGAVGLALVLRHPGRGRWRTWALVGFGLWAVCGVAQMALNAVVFTSTDQSAQGLGTLVGSVSSALVFLTLIAWGFVIAALLAGRSNGPEAVGAEEPSSAADRSSDDPLAYDPADFMPPRPRS
ncbi:hypothetical protein N802_18170 [Knoellia sinensis KCTC 19936]|uniref:Uncharacterized protein n=1 Tax=Knoellia sinensis KCTC 19936 TaxID=1385520 RepID=A0A0A0J4J6_9MICO|nr:hypothetical protein [Knoellia sinensis]KGN32290.1 hypothetical protein N802_18170 [Knoellia sinensis KCTC 19936]